MAQKRAASLSPGDVAELIRGVLERAPEAVSATQVHRALPRAGGPAQAVVLAALEQMRRDGAVHAWPGGRSPRFWVRSPEDAVRETVLRVLGGEPQSEGALRKAVTRPVASRVGEVLARLVTDGQVYRHPPIGRTKTPLYGLAPPDPLRYLAPMLDRVVRDGLALGFDEGRVKAAITRFAGGTGDGTVRAAILQLNPGAAEGALVYVPHLRVALGSHFPDKAAFDRALLGLLATGQIQLQAHPVPSQLNPEEKDAMVPDGRGSYYMAVGLRQR